MSRRCRSCHAPVIWARTVKEEKMPIDADPTPDGNVRLFGDGWAVVLHRDIAEQYREAGVPLYRSHFASCPNAEKHRKRRVKA